MASDGADQLGGKDWDDLIVGYIYSDYTRQTGKYIPDDMGWEIQQKALEAKFELSENDKTTVLISIDGNDVEIELHRSPPVDSLSMEFELTDNHAFYFEERSKSLLTLCRTICQRVIEKANLTWGSIDDVVLAGGSCRMPMIPDMLENMSGKKIQRHVPGFSYDTAIAIGAAIYGANRSKVKDVSSKSIGIEVKINGRSQIEHLINKNEALPITYSQEFKAEKNAVLKVYEGESTQPDECRLRGRLELENPECTVKVVMDINEDGVLSSIVEIPPDIKKCLIIKDDNDDINVPELTEKVSSIDIRL